MITPSRSPPPATFSGIPRQSDTTSRISTPAGRSWTRSWSSSKRSAISADGALASTLIARSSGSCASSAPASRRSDVALPPHPPARPIGGGRGAPGGAPARPRHDDPGDAEALERARRVPADVLELLDRRRVRVQVALGEVARTDPERLAPAHPVRHRADGYLRRASPHVDDRERPVHRGSQAAARAEEREAR